LGEGLLLVDSFGGRSGFSGGLLSVFELLHGSVELFLLLFQSSELLEEDPEEVDFGLSFDGFALETLEIPKDKASF
jgi:hypothetical protein